MAAAVGFEFAIEFVIEIGEIETETEIDTVCEIAKFEIVFVFEFENVSEGTEIGTETGSEDEAEVIELLEIWR
jgi:hypothetical protein